MKVTAIEPNFPAVTIELTAKEAEILMDLMGNISGRGPRDVTSEIYNGLGRLGYESHAGAVVDYKDERWAINGTISWKKI